MLLNNLLVFKKHITSLYEAYNIKEKSEIDLLFCEVLNLTRAELLLKDTITNSEKRKVLKIAKKRIKGKPLSKIIKNCAFYGNMFKVNKNVLTPRQDTELLVQQVIEDYKATNNKKILDLCTGSGAIAISLSKNLKAKITATDISNNALKIAKYNAKKLQANINLIKSDLFNNVEGKFNAIVSNPPYIKTSDINNLQIEVKKYDPIIALNGGEDGLEFYREIIKKAPQKLVKNGKIYLELGKGKYKALEKLLQKNFIDIKIIKDYNNIKSIKYTTKR